jgi:multicomponent Na+:H+ antiporter subunit B
MRGLILPTATTWLMPVLVLFSVFLLLRGHNEPGGGFAGGLVLAAAFILLSIADGVREARETLHADPRSFIGTGLLLMLLAGIVAPLLYGEPFLTAHWWSVPVTGAGFSVGTPLLFDIGVYLAVAGTILLLAFSLEEEEE